MRCSGLTKALEAASPEELGELGAGGDEKQTRGRVYLDGVVTLVDAYYMLSYLGKAELRLSVQ